MTSQTKLMKKVISTKVTIFSAFGLDVLDVFGMDWDQGDSTTKLTSKKEYDCVICNQTTPSSEDAPMGLVVLIQVRMKYL